MRRWLDAGDVERVAARLIAMDEPARRAVAAPLREYQPGPMPEPPPNLAYAEKYPWIETTLLRRDGALMVAGAGCLPEAAEIIAWLRRVDHLWRNPLPETVDAVGRVLQAPGRPPLAEIACGLAERMHPDRVALWPLVGRLLELAGREPPPTEAVLRGWMREIGFGTGAGLTERLRDDPRTPLLVPQIFAIPGLGAELGRNGPAALAALDSVPRGTLLDGCLLRLTAGDRPGCIEPVAQLHRLLSPTPFEYEQRCQKYAGLLASPYPLVVELALQALAQLLTDAPSLPVFEMLLTGIGHESVELAEQALTIAVALLPALGPAGRELLAMATSSLTGDLRRQADAALGTTAPGPTGTSPAPTAGFFAATGFSAPMPPPIASVPELAAAAATMLHHGVHDMILVERLLDALVRLARTDRPALAAALAPILHEHWESTEVNCLRAVVTGTWTLWSAPAWDERHLTPFTMTTDRFNEIGRALTGDLPPALLATPATVDGYVDPARVLALLVAAENDGWEPGPSDLTQALLRLPRSIDPALVRDAARLRSPAGRAFAEWVRTGGLPAPEVAVVPARRDGQPPRLIAAFDAIDHPPLSVAPSLLALPASRAYERAYARSDEPVADWPAMLPGHREIVAAHLQPRFAEAAGSKALCHLDTLPTLADCGGQFGPAMALCVAYGLAAGNPTGRLAAVDAYLRSVARHDNAAALIGRQLAALTGLIVIKRVVEALTEALRAGAADPVQATVRELAPTVLDQPTTPPGALELLTLAPARARLLRTPSGL